VTSTAAPEPLQNLERLLDDYEVASLLRYSRSRLQKLRLEEAARRSFEWAGWCATA
jgi:hypothetical protein